MNNGRYAHSCNACPHEKLCYSSYYCEKQNCELDQVKRGLAGAREGIEAFAKVYQDSKKEFKVSMVKKETVKTFDGECTVTERKLKHPKSGEMTDYLSVSNGTDVCGFFIGENTKKEIAKFLTKKEPKNGSNSDATK